MFDGLFERCTTVTLTSSVSSKPGPLSGSVDTTSYSSLLNHSANIYPIVSSVTTWKQFADKLMYVETSAWILYVFILTLGPAIVEHPTRPVTGWPVWLLVLTYMLFGMLLLLFPISPMY